MNHQSGFDYSRLLAGDLPAPAAPFTGFPKYMFVGGHNDPASMPVEGLAASAARMVRAHGRDLSKYNFGMGPMGFPGLREHIADKVQRRRGIHATAEDVLVTHGSNQGIDFVIRLFVKPGDTVLLEEKTYHGAITRFNAAGARSVGVPLDEDGIDVGALTKLLEGLSAAGTLPKLLYTIPTVQNPTGSILPLERRRALLDLARKYGFVVVEDECYADLVWEDVEVPPSLFALDPECVVHIGSLSKSLSPALRLGYVIASSWILALMVSVKNDGGVGAIDQIVAADFFGTHFDAHTAMLSARLREKMDVMVRAVVREFGDSAEFVAPKGGVFLWLQLDSAIDVRKLLAPAAALGVSFNAGPEWSVDGEAGRSQMRLCFALPGESEIQEGVAVLARLCRDAVPRAVIAGQPATV